MNENTRLAQKRRLAGRPNAMPPLPADWHKKIFCIGRNKTGTTSLAAALRELGVRVGNQKPAELLLKDWAVRDFRRLVAYCHTAQAFQDIPFSLPYTFQAMDMHFPESKFILTVRDSADQWYHSLVKFHKKIWGEKTASLEQLALPRIKWVA
ncbi:MAG: sulfotransferase [Pseudomonadota bacterium]